MRLTTEGLVGNQERLDEIMDEADTTVRFLQVKSGEDRYMVAMKLTRQELPGDGEPGPKSVWYLAHENGWNAKMTRAKELDRLLEEWDAKKGNVS